MSALGRDVDAIAYADRQVTIDRAWGAPGGLGQALRVRAIVGNADEATERLLEAVARLRASPRRLEFAHGLVDLGVALRRAGQRTASRTPLREGLDLAAACAASPLIERARSELLVAGARPRRHRLTGRNALTPSEERIAELAARGHTNRSIAQQLFLTPKTVETRLTSAYRKLNIAGRADLATALAAPIPDRGGTSAKTGGGPPYSGVDEPPSDSVAI